MSCRPYNIMSASGNFIGMYPLDYNQFLQSDEYKIDIAANLPINIWSNQTPVFVNNRIYQGIVDHFHYVVSSGVVAAEDLNGPNVWNSDLLILNLPEASGQYVNFLAHDRFHRAPRCESKVYTLGPFNIDLTPPDSTIQINEGQYSTDNRMVTVTLNAVDEVSGVKEYFITGDVEPEYSDQWIPYEGETELELTAGNGKKNVNITFRDFAGNESQVFNDHIIYGIIRYYFLKTNNSLNRMAGKNAGMKVSVHNMTKSNKSMNKGSEHGVLSTY